MENFKLITPGEKIKNIRKLFNFRQHEISGNDITRNLISMIEREESNLTKSSATIISNNINELCIKKNINFSVTSEYLLESLEDQLNSIICKFIDSTKDCTLKITNGTYDNFILNIEKNINIYSTAEEKFNFYQYLGNVYEKSNDYAKVYFYYLRAYENSGTSTPDTISNICALLAYCCIKLGDYSGAINYNKVALYENEKKDLFSVFTIHFNNIIAFNSLCLYDQSLKEICCIEENLSSILKSDHCKQFYFFCLKSNCFKGMKKFDLALNINKNMIKSTCFSPLSKVIIFTNIIEIYIELNDMKNLEQYLNKFSMYLDTIQPLESDPHLPAIYYSIALGYLTISEKEIAKDFLYKALNFAKEHRSEKFLLKSLNELINLDSDSTENLTTLTSLFKELVELKFIAKYNYVLLNIINLYSKRNDCTSISALVTFIENIEE